MRESFIFTSFDVEPASGNVLATFQLGKIRQVVAQGVCERIEDSAPLARLWTNSSPLIAFCCSRLAVRIALATHV